MAKDLKNFVKNKNLNGNIQDFIEKQVPNDQKQYAKTVKNQMDALSGKSEDELMNQLMNSITQGKKDGSFTPEMLKSFVKNVSPMLNASQKQRLNQLINKIQ